jgi:hypothetical protein
MIKFIKKPKKIKKFNKRIKSEKQKFIKKLDELYSLVVRTRDNFKCQKEGCPASGKYMHCAHIFTRSRMFTRWDLDNGITFCYYHHLLWSHREPVEFTLWCMERLGKEKFEELRKKSIAYIKKIDENEMKEIYHNLEEKIKEFELKNNNRPF